MQKIVPHLWFDTQAKEAAAFYVSAFGDESRVVASSMLEGTPSGSVDMHTIEICNHRFMLISAGPYFKMNPSISFFVNFDPSSDPHANERLDALWKKLSEGGTVLMPLDSYPFSSHYGWIQDRYGVSWQLILTNPAGDPRPKIIPSLLFTNEKSGNAKAATDFYLSIFKHAKRGQLALYDKQHPGKEGHVMFTDFTLEDVWFAAMDGGNGHAFTFNEGISFVVSCDTQEEIDYYWEKISAVPESEQCGWVKDQFGVSWQIVPTAMEKMFKEGSKEQITRVTQAFLKMKKFDIATLERAYNGE